MKYESGSAFRRALEKRLLDISQQSGIALNYLRKMVAFDRFLARLFKSKPDHWILKGGLALQLRLGNRARTTKDMDVLAFTPGQDTTETLREAARLDLGDWFLFEIAEPVSRPVGRFGGIRHGVQSLLDSRTFEQFHIDIGVGDPVVESVEYLDTPPLLEFAGISSTQVPCYPISQQIAEKLHAYTRPHLSGESSRVKDFVDILLLSGLGKITGENVNHAIQATFASAATHPLPATVPPPPKSWEREFQYMAKNLGLGSLSIAQAYALIQNFLDPILAQHAAGEWDTEQKIWRI